MADTIRTPPSPEEPAVGEQDLLDSASAGARAIRGGAIRVITFAVTVLLGVGSSALLYRHLRVVAAGHYVTILSLVTLCGGLTDAGLAAIGVRGLATRDAEGRRRLMGSLGGVRLFLAFVGVIVAVAFAAVAGYGQTLVLGAVIAGVGMILVVLQDTYAIPLTAGLRMGWVAAGELLRTVGTAIAIVALVLAGAGLLPFYAAVIPGALAGIALTAWLVRREVPLRPTVRLGEWRELLRNTLSYSLATAVSAVYFRVAIILVSLVSNAHQTGYFAVSFRGIEVLVSVPVLLVGAAFPIFARAARDDHARLSYAVGRTFEAVWIVGLALALALVVGAPFIIEVVAGPLFHPADQVLRIQGLTLIATCVGAVWGYTLLSLHRHRQVLVVSLLALALTVVLTATLASVDGARGAAIGTTTSEFALMVMLGIAVRNTGLRPVIGGRAFWGSAIAAAAGAATLLIPGLADVIRVVLALGIYGGGLLAFGALPRELIEQIPFAARLGRARR